jgi:hypothetical protein
MSRVDSNSDDLQSASTHNFSYSVSYHNYPDTRSRSSLHGQYVLCQNDQAEQRELLDTLGMYSVL